MKFIHSIIFNSLAHESVSPFLNQQIAPALTPLPTATGDLDPYVVNYYSVFSKLNCEATHISFFKRTIDLEEHVLKQDAIFVGGGNTKTISYVGELLSDAELSCSEAKIIDLREVVVL